MVQRGFTAIQLRNVYWLLLPPISLCITTYDANAVPSFAAQTGQPCAACHVGAYGPQLRPYGRDFKLNGYTASDGGKHFPPIAVSIYGSFTHTSQDQPGPASRWFAPNDNLALDQLSFYYAGAITRHLGAFIQTTYDGVARQYQIDNTDIRYARERDIFGIDSVWGLTLNNSPTVQDLWNSTPTWGFPYNSSALAPTPTAATRIDGSFAQSVMGLGAYVMWNDWVYTEFDLYRGLGRDIRNALGTVPVAGTDSVVDTAPYWRLAVQHDFGRSNWEIGTYGIAAHILPGGVSPSGKTDSFIDAAADANWQFSFDPLQVTGNVISTHATIIHEDQDLAASAQLTGANHHGNLTTMRADISYSIAATVTPSAQLFRTTGSNNAAYWSTPAGRPDSDGAILEIAYVPFGKPDSIIHWGNLRLAIQYILYSRFDGETQGASHNNTLYLSAWAAWHF
jgi:hypothetical protein